MRNKPTKTVWIRCSSLFVATVAIAITAHTPVRSTDQSFAGAPVPLPVFTDITRQAGLNMKIVDGDEMTQYLTDVNGEGACFLDYNHDGYQDIFLVNGTSRSDEAAGRHPHDYLLRNNGDGTFTDVA